MDSLGIFWAFCRGAGHPASAAPCRRTMDFESLTRRHGIKVDSDVSIEERSSAVREVVGHEHVFSASRMNRAIVLFLSSVEKANEALLLKPP